jgi:hypothetical protein
MMMPKDIGTTAESEEKHFHVENYYNGKAHQFHLTYLVISLCLQFLYVYKRNEKREEKRRRRRHN